MNGESKSILLVEDDPNDAMLALSALGRQHSVNVTVVQDGAEALDYLYCRANFHSRPAGNPDVMLLDLKMPKVTGLEVLRQIKADPQLRTIPIVMLTSSRETLDLSECYSLGVNAYVVKPVQFDQYLDAVEGLGTFWAVINEPPPNTQENT